MRNIRPCLLKGEGGTFPQDLFMTMTAAKDDKNGVKSSRMENEKLHFCQLLLLLFLLNFLVRIFNDRFPRQVEHHH